METEREKCPDSGGGPMNNAPGDVLGAVSGDMPGSAPGTSLGAASAITPGDVSGDAPSTVEVSVFVHDDLGLHARPAARVTQTAQQFEAEVTLILGTMRADAKSILDVLSLAAPRGTTLRVQCAGQDAQEAAAALSGLFTQSLLGRGA